MIFQYYCVCRLLPPGLERGNSKYTMSESSLEELQESDLDDNASEEFYVVQH